MDRKEPKVTYKNECECTYMRACCMRGKGMTAKMNLFETAGSLE
jgi:hypothetical protein